MHRIIYLLLLIGYPQALVAQHIAPEGKIIKDRTLDWSDFLGKPTKSENGYAAATAPVIYAVVDDVEELRNDRIAIKFRIKCAFQSASWVREGIGQEHSQYLLNHEQAHYDIALTFANKLQTELTSRDFSKKNYHKEIDDIYFPLVKRYEEVQDAYDKESDHSLIKQDQHLWDCRIKKCLESNSLDFYSTPENAIERVSLPGEIVVRLPEESKLQFAVRCRPIYAQLDERMSKDITEWTEWTPEKTIIAFYVNYFKRMNDEAKEQEAMRLMAYAFMPLGKENKYKKVLIDTFESTYGLPKVASVFFANADTSDKLLKEMFIITSVDVKTKDLNGKYYTVKAYDNTGKQTFPNRVRRMKDINALFPESFEGIEHGKPVKAKFSTQQSVIDELKRLGY